VLTLLTAVQQPGGDARALLTERRSASQKEKTAQVRLLWVLAAVEPPLCCTEYVRSGCVRIAQAPAVVEEEADVLDLDAIFRRTTEEPALYWLPLTEEQAAARAAAKAKPSSDAAQNDKGPQQNGSVTDVKARP